MTLLLKGRRSYSLATLLSLVVHALLGYGLWVLQTDFVDLNSINPPSLDTHLVTPSFEPLPQVAPVQSNLIIEQPPPPPPTKPPQHTPIPSIEQLKALQKKAAPAPRKVAPKKKVSRPERVAPVKKGGKPSPSAKPGKKKQEAGNTGNTTNTGPRATDELDELVKALNAPSRPATTTSPAPDPEPLSPELLVAGRFVKRIRQQIEAAWIHPPNVQYREMAGLKVLIRLTLEPGGRLVNARILSSSGNAQFDRSALNAVYKVGRFDVPADADIFDQFFRQVNINYSL